MPLFVLNYTRREVDAGRSGGGCVLRIARHRFSLVGLLYFAAVLQVELGLTGSRSSAGIHSSTMAQPSRSSITAWSTRP